MQEYQEDYYELLGVGEEATPDDIRKAYLKLAKKLHPDRFPNDPEKRAQAQAQFSKVTRAHEVLGDPKQRDEYDGLRKLAKSRAALDAGVPGSSSAPAAAQSAPGMAADKVESKEAWAAKHYTRAMEHLQRKRYQEAETAIKEAIRLVQNNTKYHTTLAEIYIARGWRTLAMTELQTALRIDPKDAEAKQVEMKLKAVVNKAAGGAASQKEKEKKPGLLDQLKQLLGKKG